jgi:hypothetical protein
MVVYNIKCVACNAQYIGKTKRILKLRLDEHKTKPESACTSHENSNPGHHMNYDDVEILDSADSDRKLRIKELLHILKRKPELNRQLNSQSQFDIKTIIIAAYPQFRQEQK